MLWLTAQPAEAREPDEVAKLLEHIRFATMERVFITERVQPHEHARLQGARRGAGGQLLWRWHGEERAARRLVRLAA